MLLVVMMHSILGVEQAVERIGSLHALVDFATSFRVPAFFLIAGLFLRRAMALSWRDLFARRIYGLVILYLVWLAIHLGLRSVPGILADPSASLFGPLGLFENYARALIDPFGLLWFIHLMVAFILAARLVYMIPKAMPFFILAAALLETARITTGQTLIDEFSSRFFYFLVGLWLAPLLLPGGHKGPRARAALAEPSWLVTLQSRPWLIAGLLALWFAAQLGLVLSGHDKTRGLSLFSGLAGAGALLLIGLWLATQLPLATITRFFLLIGRRSIVIYLVFTLPMGAIREVLIRIAPALPVDLLSFVVVIGAVAIALGVERLARASWLSWLFSRPVLGGPAKADPPRRS